MNNQTVLGKTLDMTYDMTGMPMDPPNNPIIEKARVSMKRKSY